MDKAEAERRFQKADKLFTYGRFEDALADLDALEAAYPDNHRVLNAKIRTLEQLQRFEEALPLCDRLVDHLGYDKAHTMRERIREAHARGESAPQQAFWANNPSPPSAAPNPPAAESAGEVEENVTGKPAGRFRIKPIRLLILICLVAGMYFGYVPTWLGGGLIGAYFIIKYVLIGLIGKWLIMKLFTAPFKMKGKALEGAQCVLHGVEWTEAPPPEEHEEDDDDTVARPLVALRYAWLDVTITPQERTKGFTHWEPGELALAPLGLKYKTPDDMDHCFQVRDVKIIVDGEVVDEEGMKYHGPQRLRLLVGLPMDQNDFKFVYYFEQFGELRVGS